MTDTLTDRRESIAEKSGGRCWYCGVKLHFDKSRSMDTCYATLDHVVAQAVGGSGRKDNLVAACRRCNCGKNKRTVEDYRLSRRFKAAGLKPMNREQIDWCLEHGFDVLSVLPEVEFWGEIYVGLQQATD